MKNLIYIIGPIVVVLGAWFLVRAQSQARNSSASHQSSQTSQPAPKDIYLELRNQALHSSRAKFGFAATPKPADPWGVLMDLGLPNGSATVVAFSDGSASIYLSSGGGYIGGKPHKSIHDAAQRMVLMAAELQPTMRADGLYPLPKPGETSFYFLTDTGMFSESAREEELGNPSHRLHRIFAAGQEVITQYRLLQEPN